MSLSNLDRLIFIVSFLAFMNWGTRIVKVVLTSF